MVEYNVKENERESEGGETSHHHTIIHVQFIAGLYVHERTYTHILQNTRSNNNINSRQIRNPSAYTSIECTYIYTEYRRTIGAYNIKAGVKYIQQRENCE